jgi:hypothetical protein
MRLPFVEVQVGVGAAGLAIHPQFAHRSEEGFQGIQAMHAQVAERIRALGDRARQRATGIRRIFRVAHDLHRHHVADASVAHGLHGLHEHGIEEVGVVHAELQLARARGGDHRLAIGHRIGHRLFHQHMAAHVHRPQGDGGMEGRRRQHIDRLGTLVRQFVQMGRDARHLEAVGQRLRRGEVRVADADDVDEIQLGQGGEVMGGDIARADDGNAQAGGSGNGHGAGVIMEVCGR